MTVSLFGQGPQSEFLEAKRLYREGDYRAAQSAFSSLYQDRSFGPYASFFAGLSAYQLDEKDRALTIWRQLLSTHPDWDQLPELYHWMILTNYELEEYEEAVRVSMLLELVGGSEEAALMADRFLPIVDLEILRGLSLQFPDFKPLGRILAGRLAREYPDDIETIRELIRKFRLDPMDFSPPSKPNIRKEEYAIAVLYPFLFDGLEDPGRVVNNKVVMELYQGMKLAEYDLEMEGNPVKLYPYDTRRSAEVTQQLLETEEIENADVIVGPLFPGPNYVVDSFAREHEINMVNPVSSNSSVIGNNPYSFLLKPTNETVANNLADFAARNYGERGALIYYGATSQDTAFANTYRERLEEHGVEITQFRTVDIKSSKALLDSLIEKEDIFMESLEQLDSMMAVPGKIIKSRKPKPTVPSEKDYLLPTGRYPGDSSVFYETKYFILQNSIGHIAVISRDNSIINSFIGVVETRADTMGLVGYGNWLELDAVDYEQLERLEVALALPEFIDELSPAYQALYRRFQSSCLCLPSIYHILGYEGTMFLGRMLHKHGTNFQYGWLADGLVPGEVVKGYDYGLYRDNQVVPIVRLKNLVLEEVVSEEDDEE